MEKNKKPSFNDLVKSEIQDLDETLSNILNAWGENPVPLTDTYSTIIKSSDNTIGVIFDDKYDLPQSVKQKIEEIFYSDSWE